MAAETQAPLALRELDSPARPGSGQPNLVATADGRVLLSWIEPAGEKRHALRFAERRKHGAWSEPRTIAEGAGWFVNWADFPSLAALPDGTLFAHWLARSGPGTYAYDVNLSASRDGGKTWSEPTVISGLGAGAWNNPGQEGHMYRSPWPILLKDGRILVLFARRRQPTGIGGIVSSDRGKTWSEELPIGKTITLPVQSSDTLKIDEGGSPTGYVLYAPAPGATATIDVADLKDYCVKIEASYVILRGVTLKGARVHAITFPDAQAPTALSGLCGTRM